MVDVAGSAGGTEAPRHELPVAVFEGIGRNGDRTGIGGATAAGFGVS